MLMLWMYLMLDQRGLVTDEIEVGSGALLAQQQEVRESQRKG